MFIADNRPTIRFDSVIFATDFSLASQNAGLYASAFSRQFAANLVVAHGFNLTQAALDVEVESPLSSQQRSDLSHRLAQIAEELGTGCKATETVLLEGDPRVEIPGLARRKSPALVVMGTHGRGALDRLVLGSNAEGILRHSSEPALTVGPKVNPLTGDLKIRRILFASDCTAEAAHAAAVAVALAGAFSAELDVLNSVRSSEVDDPAQFSRIQERYFSAVEAILPQNAHKVCEPHTYIRVGHPHAAILKHVDEREIDLLILKRRKGPNPEKQNGPSRAFPIILASKCPVLSVAAAAAFDAI
jgi:nucleotide-binding universal stress UspA family protein